MRSLRTIHVETGMHALGGPAQVIYLLTGLKQRGHEAYLVCPSESSIAKLAISAGLDVITMPLHTDLDASFVVRLSAVLRRLKPDVVYLHSRRGADIMGGIASRLCHVPAVVLSRRIDNPVRKGLISNLKYGYLCDHIIAISEGIVAALIAGGVSPEKVTCVRSVVDAKKYQDDSAPGSVRQELGIAPDANLVAIAAQLIERKGHRFLFTAAPKILSVFPNTVFLVLGEGRLDSELRKLASSLNIQDNAVFAGFRNDMPRVLRDIDLLVHPATMEGLGIAILQAMSAGVPVVASNVGGIPESVRDGVNGILIPPQDSDTLAKAVMRLLGSPELRRTMGSAGRRIVEEEFSVDGMVEGVLSVYYGILGIEKPSARVLR